MSLSNKEIEDRAIKAVIDFEKSEHREAKDIRRQHKSYDVHSGNRIIEVKGIEKSLQKSGNWRFIQQKSVQLALKEDNFYLYIIDNLGKGVEQAGIYVLNREEALKFLRIQPQVSYSLHIPAELRDGFKKK